MSDKTAKTNDGEAVTIEVKHIRHLEDKILTHAFKDGRTIKLELNEDEYASLATCLELVITRLEDSIKPGIFKKPDEETITRTNARVEELKDLRAKLEATIVSYSLARIMADRKKKGAKNNGNRD